MVPSPIADAYDRARAAWPDVQVDPDAFASHVQARAGDDVTAVRSEDLYLACACLQGQRAALDAFERAFAPTVAASLARFDLSEAEKKDIAQSLRIHFFVKGKLAGYSGRGALRGWVRSAATRAALDVLDARKLRPDAEDEILDSLPATGDPELEAVRGRFATEFRAAFAATVAALEAADRAVLAQHYVDGLSIDQLAVVHGVHRATAARRIVKLREALLAGTRQRLQQALAIDAPTFESLMRLAQSRLDVSVFRLLRG